MAIPDDQNLPAIAAKFQKMLLIACDITLELWAPIAFVRFGLARIQAFFCGMQMPKAAVHEDDFAARAEYEIGFARQVFAVQAVAVAERMYQSADGEFGFGVGRADRGHVGAAAGRGEAVGQRSDLRNTHSNELIPL